MTTFSFIKVALLAFFFSCAQATMCTEGCNTIPKLCICAEPFATCNNNAGHCISGHCDGECQTAGWVTPVSIIIGLLFLSCIGGCIYKCCIKSSPSPQYIVPPAQKNYGGTREHEPLVHNNNNNADAAIRSGAYQKA